MCRNDAYIFHTGIDPVLTGIFPVLICVIGEKQYNEVPLRVEYSLSEAGRAMLNIYYEMAVWGEKYLL